MLALQETPDQLVYRYRGVMAPALAVGGAASGLFALLAGSDPWLALLATGCSAWAARAVYAHSEFRFDGATRRVTGWRTAFRQTQRVELPFSDIQGVRIETVHGGHTAYRVALETPAGLVPLVATYRSDPTIRRDAQRIHAWLQAQGVLRHSTLMTPQNPETLLQ